MAQAVETISDMRGHLVAFGLATPASRGFSAAVIAAGVSYLAKNPAAAFRSDGSLRPIGSGGGGADPKTLEFLKLPVGIGLAVALFT